MSPAIIILSVFFILPILFAVFLSFTKAELLGDVSFTFKGIDNFTRMFDDERVMIALKNTAQYVIIVVPLQTFLALILASALNAKIKFKNVFRVLFFLPTVTSSAVLTLMFVWILNSQGLLNEFLQWVGLPTYNWLGDPAVALKGIMGMNIWSTAPTFMVVYLAALQDVPDSLYEAAEMDGATWLQKFWRITVPMLRPATTFVVIMGIVGTFQLFDQAYIFSNGSGGPNNSTLTVVLLVYQYAFKNLEMGYASALTLMLASVIMVATLLQRLVFKEEKLD
ncbi:sugar ABC transporter permease [Paenibacillus psychroresistens]|uniref:Sugar ABC transporter permease n=2 Tax=Paenibacillus psychroresistens TaxID=1778678 RepID=A0A6B8RYE4_9BACL|nr:sugar ABC transporter permease [Paenibacillus psychroresistens]